MVAPEMQDPATQIPTTHHDHATVLRWAGFVALCIGMFMAILDIQVVVTSLQAIEEALQIGADRMSWVQTSYIIAEVIAIPIIGLLLRVFGMQRLFVVSIGIFTFASIGCAASSGFFDLTMWRVLQGFAGGVLIPLVFSAMFMLFPKGIEQTMATALGGFLAVMGPTVGPVVGGWITEQFSWHWLFLINVLPGIVAAAVGFFALPRGRMQIGLLGKLDWASLLAFGLSLALLIIGLKEAPSRGWLDPIVLGCFGVSALGLLVSIKRPQPAILYGLLRDRPLAYGCILSFLLGFVLFAAVYILPVFMAFVRGHGPLAIGLIVIVMGITQLIAAPLTVWVDRFFDARLLTAIGFVGFALGLVMNSGMTIETDAPDIFWAQLLRGATVALCILPPIRIALALQPLNVVSDASGLFNLMRNIGGVIGIAVMDSVMFSRTSTHAETVMDLIRSDRDTAAQVLAMPLADLPEVDDAMSMIGIMDIIEDASLTMAINECWWLLGGVALAALPVLWLLGHVESSVPVKSNPTADKPFMLPPESLD